MKTRSLGATVDDADSHQHVLWRLLGILDEHIEVPVVIEDAGVEQLVLRIAASAAPAFRHQFGVGEGALRIFVQILHVGMAGKVVEIEVALLDIFAVIAFIAGETEHPLLQNRIDAVPQRQCEAQLLSVIGNAGDAVFAPAVGLGACGIVAEVFPGGAIRAVVLAHRSPLAFAEIGSPTSPRLGPDSGRFQSLFFLGQRRILLL
jgi:hypothetical protein